MSVIGRLLVKILAWWCDMLLLGPSSLLGNSLSPKLLQGMGDTFLKMDSL